VTVLRGAHTEAIARDGEPRVRRDPLILMYHGVAEVPEDPNQLFVSPGRFAEQMAWLERRGLRGVGVGSLIDATRENGGRGLVGITFDDGYASVLESALPELKRRDFGATVFVLSERLGGTNDWDVGPTWPLLGAHEVEALAASGIEIGSHGSTHLRLAGATPEQLASEVQASRRTLSALVGTEIRGFAYPYGSFDGAARRAVRDSGYDYACAVAAPRAEQGSTALPRIYIGQKDDAVRMSVKRIVHQSHNLVRGIRP
jgi:peptidoglycan/xylan/chitin deacetylase (PgdA/CDA1 family)